MKGMFGRNGKTQIEKNTRPVNFDARPPETRAADNAIDALKYSSVDPPMDYDIDTVINNINRSLDILLAERETTNKGIAAIKQIVAGLTYGEMVELRDQLEKHVPNIGNSEATAAIVKALPETFHAWATS